MKTLVLSLPFLFIFFSTEAPANSPAEVGFPARLLQGKVLPRCSWRRASRCCPRAAGLAGQGSLRAPSRRTSRSCRSSPGSCRPLGLLPACAPASMPSPAFVAASPNAERRRRRAAASWRHRGLVYVDAVAPPCLRHVRTRGRRWRARPAKKCTVGMVGDTGD